MNALRHLAKASPLAAAAVTLLIRFSSAQNCDYQITSADWTFHPSPDSIYISFTANVVPSFPVSSDSLHPTEFDATIRFRFNGAPYGDEHPLTIRLWQSITCPTNCPQTAVCEEKEWNFKGTVIKRKSECFLTTFDECKCPTISTPVIEKPVHRPPSSGQLEVEILPLTLTCTPINPQNDSRQFPYSPGGGGGAPATSPAGIAVLLAALAMAGMLALRRRERSNSG